MYHHHPRKMKSLHLTTKWRHSRQTPRKYHFNNNSSIFYRCDKCTLLHLNKLFFLHQFKILEAQGTLVSTHFIFPRETQLNLSKVVLKQSRQLVLLNSHKILELHHQSKLALIFLIHTCNSVRSEREKLFIKYPSLHISISARV